MRICIDAHMLGNRETGNETYVNSLAPVLSRLPGVTCAAAIWPETVVPDSWRESPIALLELHPANDWARLLFTLPTVCRRLRADILHVSYVAPFAIPCPLVVTVHDVSFKRFPEFFSARDRLLFASLLPWTLRRASAIITDSEASRQDIISFYPFVKDKVHVIPLAVQPSFEPYVPDSLESLAQFGIRSPYILAVGNLQPRKNLVRLVEAFRRLVSDGLGGHQLVLVGNDAFRSSEFRARIKDLIQADQLVLTGYVPEKWLPALYTGASVFVYPSIYEGFGLPILEAMACGAPVITSNTSSMPEVAGEAALLVDPLRTDEIADALRAVLTQPELARDLSRRGRSRAAQFSWDDTARRVLSVYHQVLEQHRRRQT